MSLFKKPQAFLIITLLITGVFTYHALAQTETTQPRRRNRVRSTDAPGVTGQAAPKANQTVVYVANSKSPDRQSLDIYKPSTQKPGTKAPIMIYVHGGGFSNGDKTRVTNKPQAFNQRGFVFISTNYRLAASQKRENDPSQVFTHPAQVQDVAAAIAWAYKNAAKFGGDPNRIFLMGHSAGAHLVSLVSTDEKYLKANQLGLNVIKGTIAIDSAMYNLVEQQSRPAGSKMIPNAFGTNPAVWKDASPTSHISSGKGIPPFLITYTNPPKQQMAESLAAQLKKASVPVTTVGSIGKSHEEVNRLIGTTGDSFTDAIFKFVNGIAKTPTAASVQSSAPTSSARSSQSNATFKLNFSQDYQPGTRDAKGQFMGGTETTYLVSHGGNLWAGVGYWRDQPGSDPSPGPQVLRKTATNAKWTVDRSWGGEYVRIDAMDSVPFTTNAQGKKLPKPETILLASASQIKGEQSASVWSRDDRTGQWTKTIVSKNNYVAADNKSKPYVRVLHDHTDKVTGIHAVFAGAAKGAIYRGLYDPTVTGRIRWDAKPEFSPGQNRIHSMAVANGALYAAVGQDDESTVGGLYKRVDGTQPKWEQVYRWPIDNRIRYKGGMRGLTAIPAATGNRQVLLGAREHPGVIDLIDPQNQHRAKQDFDVRGFFTQQWGGLGGAATIAAYNDMTAFKHPISGENLLFIGLWVNHPDQKQAPTPLGLSSWFLVRHTTGKYEYGQVIDSARPMPKGYDGLRATRTIAVSPFADDRGRVLYFGGYDAGGQGSKHNTAWIYRASIH
jgi:acetyl esterase/lipase